MASTTPVDPNAIVQAYGYVQLLEAQLAEKQGQLQELQSQAAIAGSDYDYWNSLYTSAASDRDKAQTYLDNAEATKEVLEKMVAFYQQRIADAEKASQYGREAAVSIMDVTNNMRNYASNVETSVNLATAYNTSETNTSLHFTDQVFLNNYSLANTKAQDTLTQLTQASLDSLKTVWSVNRLEEMIKFFESDLQHAQNAIDTIYDDSQNRYQLAEDRANQAEAGKTSAETRKNDAETASSNLEEEIALLEEMIKVAKNGLVSTESS